MPAMLRASSTPTPMSRTRFVDGPPPSTNPACPIVTPLSYERLLVRFRAAQASIEEQYPDPADGERVRDIQFVLGEAIASAEGGIAGEIVVSPGSLKHLVMERIREIHQEHEALRIGDDAEDEDEDGTRDAKRIDERGALPSTIGQRKKGEMLSTSTIKLQALKRDGKVHRRFLSGGPSGGRRKNPIVISTITPSPASKRDYSCFSSPTSTPPGTPNAPSKRARLTQPKAQARPPFQPPNIPLINSDWKPKELFYQGMQFATSFFLAHSTDAEVAEKEKKFHDYVRSELRLSIDHETGEAFEKAGILGGSIRAGGDRGVKREGGDV